MANEVDIVITAKDLTGPAFASAVAKMEAMKKAAKEVGGEFKSIGGITFDVSKATTSLNALKAKLQSLGIADIADVNISPGRITTQLMMLKRIIQQQKISDLLDINVNTNDLQRQMGEIAHMSETIPVNFDVSNFPDLAARAVKVPVQFEVSDIPHFTDVHPLVAAGQAEKQLAMATIAANDAGYASIPIWSEATKRIIDYSGSLRDGARYNSLLGDSLLVVLPLLAEFGTFVGPRILPALTRVAQIAGGSASTAFYGMGRAAVWAGNQIKGLNDNISKGLPLQTLGVGRWGFLTGGIELFAGALTSKGIPAILGTASGLHIMIEAIVELGGTLIPAAVAFTAFGIAAISTVTDLKNILSSTQTVNDAFAASIYPATGALDKMAEAVKPNVFVLFGEGLLIAGRNTGAFTSLAQGAGKVLDQLGARFVNATSNGSTFKKFIDDSIRDLQKWGTLIGNVGGIFGNIFKVLPGYAEMILNVGVAVSHTAETILGSKLGAQIAGIGLAAHGALFYVGLLGTAFAFLVSKGLGGAAAIFTKVAGGVAGLGKSGAVASIALDRMAVGASSLASLPWGWISIAAAGIAFLVFQLVTAKSAAEQFAEAVQAKLVTTPIQNLGKVLGTTLATSTNNANKSFYSFLSTLGSFNKQFTGADAGIFHMNATVINAAQATANWRAVIKLSKDDLVTYNTNLATVAAQFGTTQAALQAMTDAGITSQEMLSKDPAVIQQVIIQTQAYDAALKAATQTTGRYGAAQNDLNFVAGDSANAMGEQVNAMTKVNNASDSLINTLVGGRQAFISFEQAIQGMGVDAKVSGASLNLLNKQSLSLASDFYTSAIPAAQKMIDSLNLQAISTSDLTKVVATSAVQLLSFTGNNTEAKSVVVDLINNALGPGTVSLKNLNEWVKKNSTSMGGFNQIIADSTIKAGNLAGVLENLLTAQFKADLLASSGATAQMKLFTDAIVNGGTNTARFKSTRDQLIRDLELTGLSATDAKNFVNNLQKQIDTLHGKTVPVSVFASGSGGVQITDSMHSALVFKLSHLATGGKIPGFGGGDRNLALLEDGEVVVDKDRSRRYAHWLKAMGVPGMETGGMAGMPPWTARNLTGLMDPAFGSDIVTEMNKVIHDWTISPPLGGVGVPIVGPGGGSPAQNVALAQKISGWTGGEFQDLVRLWTQESGWNQFARNPSSGAYGIPQALPPSKMGPAANPPQSNVLAQETWGFDYIRGRYGSPSAAWAHEVAFNWYDDGGWLKPGPNYMWNGTGRPEHLTRDSGISGPIQLEVHGGQSEFDRFMARWIKNYVRVKGGGNVQTAFGRS